MPLLTIGALAYDTIETSRGVRERLVGGSGVYASFAASFFTESRLVGVVGEDWRPEDSQLLSARGVDLTGVEIRASEKTASWTGRYHENMNQREGVFEHNVMGKSYVPIVPDAYKSSPYVFLGSASPYVQLAALDAIAKPKLVVADTIGNSIYKRREKLLELLTRVDGFILNEEESTLLTGERHYLGAARKILTLGPRFVVVKRGDAGAAYASDSEVFLVPAYPTLDVVDTTGAGDAFGGAMTGYLAAMDDLSSESMKKALLYATVVASLNIEGASLERLRNVTREDIERRVDEFKRMLS